VQWGTLWNGPLRIQDFADSKIESPGHGVPGLSSERSAICARGQTVQTEERCGPSGCGYNSAATRQFLQASHCARNSSLQIAFSGDQTKQGDFMPILLWTGVPVILIGGGYLILHGLEIIKF
jgi:hypothetical protein